MFGIQDGPKSSLFGPLPLKGNVALTEMANIGVTDEMLAALEHAPGGDCTAWGIPFERDRFTFPTAELVGGKFNYGFGISDLEVAAGQLVECPAGIRI